MWWQSQQAQAGNAPLLAVIMYADETTFNLEWGKVHPVYVTLGNLPISIRNKPEGKRLYGFIPVIKPRARYGSNKKARLFALQTLQQAFSHLLQPIRDRAHGIVMRSEGKDVFCVPRVPFIICDEKELATLTGSIAAPLPKDHVTCAMQP
eukprot:c24618_g1_i1.p1 GENE.c24618_g1_i1~~c24618_g1_i1.p1  ORF type:complete len:150 (-),score=6.53 c24618_g1_i1:359-808(-)